VDLQQGDQMLFAKNHPTSSTNHPKWKQNKILSNQTFTLNSSPIF
jgi:hypothetical protein